MKIAIKGILAVIGLLLAYLLFWPVNADPVVWEPPVGPELSGEFEPNDYLQDAEILGLNDGIGPEDVAVDDSGNMYAGYEDGRIIKYDVYGKSLGVFADTKGRPLGLAFDADGNLIIADANKGLLSADINGNLIVLTTEVHGIPFAFTDDVDIGPDGKIYFTDASSKYGIHDYRMDLMEHRSWGRLIMHDPKSGLTGTLMGGLYFANGVAVSPDGDFVLVNETSAYRIQKYWLKGEKAGQAETIMENLPGFPDGISSNGKGIFWLALPALRKDIIDNLAGKPFLRKMVLRLPETAQPAPDRHGFVLGIDGNGNVIHNLQHPSPESFSPITSVEEKNGILYLGSLTYPGFARISAPE
ncbi:MAG: strictosidine synthase family protein [Candidatus Marinimicrobia bacterium]|jgi:sugar lactone lactonase YvrE|nr:strictosidine synthase family protein [Candidatus Neomarinimicrobiota bacterium]MBT3676333.1 strictosidine synthase family protein [Candidatus Neomarinimicrobiota bacterium]MBT4068162.1 strictosidine synthase family protein [Candidatus Neomarinimicrobiota bacterium]MBT4270112.1 strictosidine synthase family protein [Candidatus Neomarinimicrobiota bacterium]MBT4371256.1 strictosidine synthase family protein [Candidatus Neomarinimicrobiota bacterium]